MGRPNSKQFKCEFREENEFIFISKWKVPSSLPPHLTNPVGTAPIITQTNQEEPVGTRGLPCKLWSHCWNSRDQTVHKVLVGETWRAFWCCSEITHGRNTSPRDYPPATQQGRRKSDETGDKKPKPAGETPANCPFKIQLATLSFLNLF